ncbi:beta strand repeat-containing protein [Terriglobus saanensis]|nr:FG-GAP-like repeat-containing protein [Terriglobus saanensis]
MAPELDELKKRAAAASGGKPSRTQIHPDASGVGGSNVNFPGFISAPYVNAVDGDPNIGYSSVSGDFNGDGKMDVATVKVDGVIDVILNPGTFANIASVTPVISNDNGNTALLFVENVIAADMNNDGFTDLIGQDFNNNAIVIWLSNGDGTFAAPASYPVKFASGAAWYGSSGSSIMVGDFNGDGALDIVTLNIVSSFSPTIETSFSEITYVNNSNGRLTALPEEVTTFPDYYSSALNFSSVFTTDGIKASGIAFVLTDNAFNASFNGGSVVGTMLSNGDGTFKAPVAPTKILIPNADIFVANVSFLSANLTSEGTPKLPPPGTVGSGFATTDFVFMEADGAVWDVPFTSGNPITAHVLVGYPNFAFSGIDVPPVAPPPALPTLLSTAMQSTMTLNVADMTGDGLSDLVVYSTGSIAVFPNAGAGVFTAEPAQIIAGTPQFFQPAPANYDGSAYNSLVSADSGIGQYTYYQNLGAAAGVQSGQFLASPMVTGTNTAANAETYGTNIRVDAAVDVDGDGVPELIAQTTTNGSTTDVVIGYRNGAGAANQSSNYTFTTIASAGSIGSATGTNLSYVQPVTISNATTTTILLATGSGFADSLATVTAGHDGKFGPVTQLNLGTTTCFQLNYADVGDTNGDGIPDIVAACGGQNGSGSGFYTLLGNGDGTFKTATFIPLGYSLYMVKLINFTGGKGKLDIAAIDHTSLFTGNVYVIPNVGDDSGNFAIANQAIILANYEVVDIVAGDYNVDGKQDLTLLTAGQWSTALSTILPNTAGVLLLPGNGDYSFGKVTIADGGHWPIWGSYADFNSDGAPDLAFVQTNNQYIESASPSAVQILPNLGGGNFGPAVTVPDSYVAGAALDPGFYDENAFTLVGKFTNSGGIDLIVSTFDGTGIFVNRGVTSMALTSNSPTPAQGTAVTLIATLGQIVSAGVTETGLVSFAVNGTPAGTAQIANGVATLTTTALPAGSDLITAAFAGDANHNQSNASVTLVVGTVAPAFAITATPATLTLPRGATGTVMLSIAANSTFSGTVQLACTGTPAETSCIAGSTSMTLSAGQSAGVTIVIATTPPNNTYQARNAKPLSPWGTTLGGVSLAGMLLLLWPKRRRLPTLFAAIVLVALGLGAAGMSGCSSGGTTTTTTANQYPGTTAGTYTLTVTVTSGGLTQTQPIALTVTQ